MANDFTDIWNAVLLRAPLDPIQAQAFVKDSFQQFAEHREWSWLTRNSTIAPPQVYNTGTASVEAGSAVVTGVGTVWTQSMIGRQFRFGNYTPIYTISAVNSATSLVLDQPWIGQDQTAASYQLYQCYYSTPADFREWKSLKDPQNNFRLHTNVMQAQLDFWDPQRSQSQTPRCVAFLDYGGGMNGSQGAIGDIMQVSGSGPAPSATTTSGYSYPGPATYVVTISTGGDPAGALEFTWFRITSGVMTAVSNAQPVPDNDPIDLSDGVQVYFPTADVPYVAGDVFVVNAVQDATQPQQSPRYEMWPQPMNGTYYYPFLYVAKIPEFDEAHQQLPPFVRKDVILERALEKAAMFPGATVERPNPYYSLLLAARHGAAAERMTIDLELKDDSTAIQDFIYADQTPWAPMPFADGSWLRDHAIPPGSW